MPTYVPKILRSWYTPDSLLQVVFCNRPKKGDTSVNGLTAAVIITAILAIPVTAGIIEYFHSRIRGNQLIGGIIRDGQVIILPAELRRHALWLTGTPFGHIHTFEDHEVVTNDVLASELAGHANQDHQNLATHTQIEALQAQIGTLQRQVRQLQRQNRRLRIRIHSQFPWDVIGFVVGAIVGIFVDAFLPKHFYQFKSVTNVFVSGKLVRIDHVVNTDVLKLWGIIFAFAMLGFVIGRLLQWAFGRTRQIEVEEPPADAELQEVRQP